MPNVGNLRHDSETRSRMDFLNKKFHKPQIGQQVRCGCHGVHLDTGNFKPVGQKVPMEQHFCLVCGSDTAQGTS